MYYLPRPVSGADLALMRRIDELHLQNIFMGARMRRDSLARDGDTSDNVSAARSDMADYFVSCNTQRPNSSLTQSLQTIATKLICTWKIDIANV